MLERALSLPTGFQDSLVVGGLIQPTAVRFAKDGRIFIAEKSGLVKVFDPSVGGEATVFADLRTNVHNYWDRGLLDLELHPDFPDTPYVYVLYVHDAEIGGTAPRWGTEGATTDRCPTPPGPTALGCVVSGRLSRLTADGDAIGAVEEVLIENWPQQFPSHGIGSLAFGPDGMLYVSAGDGASFDFIDYGQVGDPLNPLGDPPFAVGEAQSPPEARGGAVRAQNVLVPGFAPRFNGKVLRVDPLTGRAASGNPLTDTPPSEANSIIAMGLRNPFRMTFRPGTSELWVGDVGWGKWEEIDRLIDPAGAALTNFGWPCFEGPNRQAAYRSTDLLVCDALYDADTATAPYYAYDHEQTVVAGDDCGIGEGSISGLAFYTEGLYPDEYRGSLFFADYSRNCIWVMLPGEDGLPDPATRRVFGEAVPTPVQLLIGPGNDLYYTSLTNGLHRISALGENAAPMARFSVDPPNGPVPLTATFDGSRSSDPDPGDTLTYAWDLDGDGNFDDAATAVTAYVYSNAGERHVGLEVTDSHGAVATARDTVMAGDTTGGPVATIVRAEPRQFRAGDSVQFEGRAAEDESTLPATSLHWDMVIQHCPIVDMCHPHVVESFEGVDHGSFVVPEHEYPYYVELILRATGSDGRLGTSAARFDPITVDLTLQSEPSGLVLALNQAAHPTPFTVSVVAGSSNSVSAPTHAGYDFAAWSDNGERAHLLEAGASGALRATYKLSSSPASLKQLGTIIARVTEPRGGGNRNLEVVRDDDYPRPGSASPLRQYDTVTSDRAPKEDWIGYEFSAPHAFSRVVFQEGRNFHDGGWFEQLGVRVRRDGEWYPVRMVSVTPPYPGTSDRIGYRSYQLDFEAAVGDAIQVFGPAGGSAHFISIGELDVFGWRTIPGNGSPPIARITRPPALVLPGDKITLDGRASFDPNGAVLSFGWTQAVGRRVALSGANTAQARFVAPAVQSPATLRFMLAVSAGGQTSAPTGIDIVLTPLTGPVDIASRGDIFVSEGEPQGSGSPDIEVIRDGIRPPEGALDDFSQYDTFIGERAVAEGYVGYEFAETHYFASLVFQEGRNFFDGGWFSTLAVEVRQEGRWIPVSGASSVPPYPEATNDIGFETYVFDFTPTSGDAIRIRGAPGGVHAFFSVAELRPFAVPAPATNTQPIAHAGLDFISPPQTPVSLDGALSHDPDGTSLTYDWRQTSGPTVELANRTSLNPSFVTPAGPNSVLLTFSLTVRDGTSTSAADDVIVTVDPTEAELDITELASIITSEPAPSGGGNLNIEIIRDGNYAPDDSDDIGMQYDTYTGQLVPEAWIGYQFPTGHAFGQLVFQEGYRWDAGGYFGDYEVQVRRNGVWRSVQDLTVTPEYEFDGDAAPWGLFTFTFEPIVAEAIRLRGTPGGTATFISIAELRVLTN